MMPSLNLVERGFGSSGNIGSLRENGHLEDDEYFEENQENVVEINSSMTEKTSDSNTNEDEHCDIPLAQLYAQREQEMIKAVEFGQNLLKRVRYLENQLALERTEKDEYQKAKGYLEEDNDALKHRIENLEEVWSLLFYHLLTWIR